MVNGAGGDAHLTMSGGIFMRSAIPPARKQRKDDYTGEDMAKQVLKTYQDCKDFVRGSCFFGVGGGGDPVTGLRMLEDDLKAGQELAWIDIGDLSDEEMTACAWGMGSIAPRDPQETSQRLAALGITAPRYDRNLAIAIQELERYSGAKIRLIIPMEPGGRNMPNPMSSGSRLGIPLANGDYTGRAIPEINQIVPCIAGFKPWPATSVDPWGNVVIIRESVNPPMAERIGKHLAVAAFGSVGMAGFLIPVREARKYLVSGTVTRSLRVGRAIRQAREAGRDPVEAAREASEAWVLFRGKIIAHDWEDRDGYMFGTNLIEGEGPFTNHQMRIWFKNENHVTWIDEKPYVTSPDLIAMIHAESGEPITNTIAAIGMKISALGMKAPDVLRTPEALSVLSPRSFGYSIPYTPIERVIITS
jgi:uncharacterized protein